MSNKNSLAKDDYWRAVKSKNIDFSHFVSPIEESINERNYVQHVRHQSSIRGLYDDEISNDFINKMDLVSRVFTLQEANPNNTKKVAAYKYLYTYTNTLNKLKSQIHESLNSLPHSRPIVLIGERGSGKTTVQNKLFTSCRKFLDDNKVIYIRCDAHKIFKLWEKYEGGDTDANILTYLHLQTLYIAAKYGYIQRLSDPLIELVEGCFGLELNSWITKRGISYVAKSTFEKRFEEIINDIDNELGFDPESSAMVTAYESALRKGGAGVKFGKWLLLARKLISQANENGYKFLFVVDGVDNILWHKKIHEKSYKRMINEIDEFTDGHSPFIRMICLREESLIKGITGDPSNTVFNAYNDFVSIYHSPPHIKELVENKISLLKDIDKLKKIFGEKYVSHRTHDGEVYKKFLGSVSVFSARFFSETEKYVCELVDDSELKGFLKECPNCSCVEMSDYYHNNIRAFSFNLLSYVSAAIREIYTTKSQDNISALLKREVYRNYFLDGNYFIRTTRVEDGSERKGGVFFNIFWFDTAKIRLFINENNQTWYGLCVYRLYQLLKHYKSLSHESLVFLVCSYFKYPREVVLDSVKKCVAFGLFMYKLQLIDGDEISHVIKPTLKADLCMNIVFSKVDILYYLGLDTPLSSGKIQVVGMHSDISGSKYSFLESAIRTSCYLLSHIEKQHQIDVYNAKKFIDSRSDNVLEDASVFDSALEIETIFESPVNEKSLGELNISLDRMISGVKNESDTSYERINKCFDYIREK